MEKTNECSPALNAQSVQENPLVIKFGTEKRWLNWKLVTVNGKVTKVPYAVSGKKASTTDPETWSTHAEAAAKSNNVGVVFTTAQTLLGIDIDHCLFPDGTIVHEDFKVIERLVAAADTYTEISPSGAGLHLYLALSAPLSLAANRQAPFEVYTSGRYFTTTLNSRGDVRPVRTVSPEEALLLLSIIGYPWGKGGNGLDESSVPTAPVPANPSLDDAAIIEKMFAAKNGDKVKVLYNGDTSLHKEDESSADFALCLHLAFWTGKNATQMERIWLASPLGVREKTQSRKDYRDRTIAEAIARCSEEYTPSITKASRENTEEKEKTTPRLWTIAEILAQDFGEEEWVVEMVIPKQCVTALSGNPGDNKTWVTIHTALCVSRGTPVFGKFQVTQGGVLIIDEEDHVRDLQKRLRLLGAKDADTIYYLSQSGIKVDDKKSLDLVLQIIKEKNIKLVILDSLVRIHQQEENDAMGMSKVFNRLQEITKAGASILFTHHHRKQQSFGASSPGQNMRGSSDILAAVDSHITIEKKRDEEDRLIIKQSKLRQAEALKPFEVAICRGPALDDKGKPLLSGFVHAGDYDEKKLKAAEVAEAIPLVLHDGMKSRLEIQEALKDEFRKTAIEDGTKLAEEAGTIERVPKEELPKKEKKLFYRLPGATPATLVDGENELPASQTYIEAGKQEGVDGIWKLL